MPDSGGLTFLAGNNEMARLIRARDWSAHPFGSPETWPQSLRSALSICLHSAFPTAIYWGPELRLLYNDAWAPIPGPRHPAALGAPAHEVWADIWHVVEPQFRSVLETGEGFYVENQMLPMRRFAVLEETYWNYSFTAIRGEEGSIAGIFNSGNETTSYVLQQRRMRLLLELGHALRAERDPDKAWRIAVDMLRQHFAVDRIARARFDPADNCLTISEEWHGDGIPPIGRRLPLSDLSESFASALAAGNAYPIDNIACEATSAFREACEREGIGAIAAVPRTENTILAGAVLLQAREPRHWHGTEIAATEDVIERTSAMIDRRRTAERERIMVREIDHRARNALSTVQSVVRLTSAPTVASFKEKVEDRILALARTHALLASEKWRTIDLRVLVDGELAPYRDGETAQVDVDGPSLALSAELAQTVALLVHELTTNAAKHGGLRTADGRLAVRWEVDGAENLRLSWVETVGEADQPVSRPRHRGFGTTLLEQVVKDQLGGTVEQDFCAEGLRCRISFPAGDPGAPRTRAHSGLDTRENTGRKQVLIAEDESIIAMAIEEGVRELGHDVFGVFASVADALEALAGGTPDLAILDANLHGKSSLPLAERLHESGVPIIFATGYGSLGGFPESLRDSPVLQKPVPSQELADAIHKVFPKR